MTSQILGSQACLSCGAYPREEEALPIDPEGLRCFASSPEDLEGLEALAGEGHVFIQCFDCAVESHYEGQEIAFKGKRGEVS
jgi:hypothetical protein